MKTLKEASQYTSNIRGEPDGRLQLYLCNDYVEDEPVNITPYYDKKEKCIALPLVVTLGNDLVTCRLRLPRDVIMECINDIQDDDK